MSQRIIGVQVARIPLNPGPRPQDAVPSDDAVKNATMVLVSGEVEVMKGGGGGSMELKEDCGEVQSDKELSPDHDRK